MHIIERTKRCGDVKLDDVVYIPSESERGATIRVTEIRDLGNGALEIVGTRLDRRTLRPNDRRITNTWLCLPREHIVCLEVMADA